MIRFLKYLFNFRGYVKRRELLIAAIGWLLLETIYVFFGRTYMKFAHAKFDEMKIEAYSTPVVDLNLMNEAHQYLVNVQYIAKFGLFIMFLMVLSLGSFVIKRLRDCNFPIWLWFPKMTISMGLIFLYIFKETSFVSAILDVILMEYVTLTIQIIYALSFFLFIALLFIPTRTKKEITP